MNDTYDIEREIRWHTDEVRKNERELDAAKSALPQIKRKSEDSVRAAERAVEDLKRVLEETKRKLEGYQHELARVQAANDNQKERDVKKRA